ncbi:hypothetical protein G6514_001987 [Epicoccum nigrum]|nr:hypothetical protein G6514_001987 [Epicoccum nigrum]
MTFDGQPPPPLSDDPPPAPYPGSIFPSDVNRLLSGCISQMSRLESKFKDAVEKMTQTRRGHTNKLKAILAQLKENTTSYGAESSESDVDHTVADIISEMTEVESEFQNTVENMTRERKYKYMALENEGWKLKLELIEEEKGYVRQQMVRCDKLEAERSALQVKNNQLEEEIDANKRVHQCQMGEKDAATAEVEAQRSIVKREKMNFMAEENGKASSGVKLGARGSQLSQIATFLLACSLGKFPEEDK